MESFKRKNKTSAGKFHKRTFHGKLQKKECDVRCKVSKEGMGPSIEIFKRKNGTFDGKFQKNEWKLSSLEIALAVIDFLEFSHAK